AAVVAVKANQAADQAKAYAEKAAKVAGEAKTYADQARGFAQQAETSAADALKSARVADAAATAAEHDADEAAYSATRADISAVQATASANAAYSYADAARTSATTAGKDAATAEGAYQDAYKHYRYLQIQEEEKRRQEQEKLWKEREKLPVEVRMQLAMMTTTDITDPEGKPGPFMTGLQWLTGFGGEDHTEYGPDDEFTKQLRKDHSMDVVRKRIREEVGAGRNTPDPDRSHGYNLLKEEGWTRPIDDAMDVLTLGGSAWVVRKFSHGRYGSTGNLFIGSYSYKFIVVSRDEKTSTAQVKITIENETSLNSFMHPPIPGLNGLWDKYMADKVNGFANWLGPARTRSQSFSWTEAMDY
ncbi:hypothetical protein HCK01_35905, partial [Streptomyces sp. AA8]|nr:hypothetical protein [Streptomyces telluris]